MADAEARERTLVEAAADEARAREAAEAEAEELRAQVAALKVEAQAARPDGFFGGGGGGGGGGGAAGGGANDEALLGRDLTPVEKAVLASARRVATEGTGENAPAHGFCFIVGDAAKLMEVDEDGDGVIGMIGKDRFNYVKMGLAHTVHDFDAVLFDIRTGALLGGNYRILNLAQGDRSGGTRHQAASAVSQAAGRCFVVKAGEDHCGCTKTPPSRTAILKVFDRCKMPADAPVCQ